MKKVILILLLLFCMHVPAFAANWVEVHNDDRYLVYVDVDSIALRKSSDNDEYAVAWNKTIYKDDLGKELSSVFGEKVDHIKAFQAYNINARQVQGLIFYPCNEYGEGISSNYSSTIPFQVSKYVEVAPDSISESIYIFVMKYYNQNKDKMPKGVKGAK